MQYVEIELDPQEIVIADPGSFMMMDNKIQMETILRWFRAKIRHLWPTFKCW
jgi:uncharacterized protein (AIM24 family)